MTTPPGSDPYGQPFTSPGLQKSEPTASYPSYEQPPYPQPPYPQPPYQPQPFAPGFLPPRNGMGTAALVCGIIAVVLSWTVYGGVILGILAICFGGVGIGRSTRGEATNRSSALAGLILGIVAIALLVILIIVGIGLYASGVR
jgi:hypothetical protein